MATVKNISGETLQVEAGHLYLTLAPGESAEVDDRYLDPSQPEGRVWPAARFEVNGASHEDTLANAAEEPAGAHEAPDDTTTPVTPEPVAAATEETK